MRVQLFAGVLVAPLAACSGSPAAGKSDGGAPKEADGGDDACGSSVGADALTIAAGGDLAAGEEQTLCRALTLEDALDVTALVGTLGTAAGHHALLLVRDQPSGPDGTAPCSEPALMATLDDGSVGLFAGVSYESDGVRYEFPSAPVQVGLRVPAGSQLVLVAHFVNAGDTAIDGCASLTLTTGAAVVAPLAFRTLVPVEQYDLVVPAHASATLDATLPPEETAFRVAAASTHMHAGGTLARLSVAEGGRVLHESTDHASAEPTVYDGAPVIVEAGQSLRLECAFDNAGATEQRFPDQMCIGGMYVLGCGFPGACP